ncbi:MAG: DNA-protecting protein DprA [Propionibacteriales bacterium]|nr:DNA-protecting protein DprA [Propionibacteriales bacterium]
MIGDSERAARATLTRIAEPGDAELLELVQRDGPEQVLDDVRHDHIATSRSARWRVRLDRSDPQTDLDSAASVGARLVCPGDDEWPEQLGGLEGSDVRSHDGRGGVPVGLWVRGRRRLDELCHTSVAIVGSRSATPYGTTVGGDLAYGLALEGVTVISGGAYGIDAAAHRGALAAESATVGVLACGVDIGYPRGHVALLSRIADEGLLVSELPPGCAPSRLRFLTRNRIIAVLSQGTLVVEAALRSGALNTAGWAEKMMRPVLAVPGPVTSPTSAGVHQLFRENRAELVTDAAEALAAVSPIGINLPPVKRGESRERDRLSEVPSQVLEAVPAVRPAAPEHIAALAGIPVDEVTRALDLLLLRGLVEHRESGWRLARSERCEEPAGGS